MALTFLDIYNEVAGQAWSMYDGDAESIVISKYPEANAALDFESESVEMERVIAAIKAIRLRRNEMNVVPSRRAKVYLQTRYPESFPASSHPFFARLASASEVEVAASFAEDVVSADNAVQIITDSATVYLPLSDLVDTEKEKARLENELKKLTDEIDRVNKKLSNESFVAKAPAAVVDAEKAKLEKYTENLKGVQAALAKLK